MCVCLKDFYVPNCVMCVCVFERFYVPNCLLLVFSKLLTWGMVMSRGRGGVKSLSCPQESKQLLFFLTLNGFLGALWSGFKKSPKIAKRWNCLAFLPTMAGTDDPHWRHHHPVVAAGDTTNEGIDPPDGAPEGKDQLTVHQRTERGTKKK